jgi:hypothetical protein
VTTSTAQPAPAPPTGTTRLVDRACTAPNGGTGFDLTHVTVDSSATRYVFGARYSGDTVQHDVLISFDLGASTYVVTGELFEDGTGIGRVTSVSTSDDIFLDPPQTVTPGVVDLSVRKEQIAAVSGTPFTVGVSLKVDGSEIETCR